MLDKEPRKKAPGSGAFHEIINIIIINLITSLIQTLLSAMESHHIMPFGSLAYMHCINTAGREFHPALKNYI